MAENKMMAIKLVSYLTGLYLFISNLLVGHFMMPNFDLKIIKIVIKMFAQFMADQQKKVRRW